MTETRAEATVPFLNVLPTEPQSQQEGTITWDFINLANTVYLALETTETLFHLTYGPTQAAFLSEWLVWLILYNFLNPLKHATASLSESPTPVSLAKWPQVRHQQQPAKICILASPGTLQAQHK